MNWPEHDRTQWFGEDWGAPVCKPSAHIEAPLGRPCYGCEEPFGRHDKGLRVRMPCSSPAGDTHVTCDFHHLCFVAGILPLTIHTLCYGFAPCRFSDKVPGEWPAFHYWSLRRRQVTCPGCAQYMDRSPQRSSP